jgi:glucokinase
MNTASNESFLGIDVGGSNIFSVLFDEKYNVLATDKVDTDARKGYESVIRKIKDRIALLEQKSAESGYRLAGIGAGVPGVVSGNGESVRTAPNLGWKNVRPLHDLGLTSRSGLNSVLANDVNAGLMGELTRIQDPPEITVSYFCGTGIGGAIALGGKLVTGFDGGAGEVGHMIIHEDGLLCGCGRKGCLEAYIGKWALNDIIRNGIGRKKTVLGEIINYDLDKKPVKSSSLKKAYEKGDEFTVDLMNNYYSRHLAAGISQVVNFINPGLVILGGGMIESMGPGLLPHIYKFVEEFSINTPPQLQLAALGDFAGPTGAAYLSRIK